MCTLPQPAIAQPSAAPDLDTGPSAAALPGLPSSGAPLGRRELSVRTTAGYGVTARHTPVSGATHRLQGGLSVGASPLEWLGFGLRLDGLLELHPNDGHGAHTSGFGDPRVFVRAGRALAPEWALGGELLVWMPGADAPSFVARATSLDARVLAAYKPQQTRVTLLSSLGVRLDNSAAVAPPRSQMRPSDILTLGVSDSNAVLAAIGGLVRVAPSVQVFGEVSGDVLVGKRAPRFSESPLRLCGGARWALEPSIQLEASAVLALSARPSLRPEAAWVPIEPRALFLLGVSYTWSLVPPPPPPPKPVAPPPPAEPPPEPKPALATLQGQIVDDQGQPVPDVHVFLKTSDGTQNELITDAYGTYRFEGVPYGSVQLEAHAVGFATQRWETAVNSAQTTDPAPRALVQATDVGVLRGLIRSFKSTPLAAHVIITNPHGKVVEERDSSPDGRVEIELPPGKYKVTIEAPGYRRQTQSVQIHGNGVSVLNTDMRRQ